MYICISMLTVHDIAMAQLWTCFGWVNPLIGRQLCSPAPKDNFTQPRWKKTYSKFVMPRLSWPCHWGLKHDRPYFYQAKTSTPFVCFCNFFCVKSIIFLKEIQLYCTILHMLWFLCLTVIIQLNIVFENNTISVAVILADDTRWTTL